MKTSVKKEGNVYRIQVEGYLDFESQEPLRKELKEVSDKLKSQTQPDSIIFDFENLQFVGSSGISRFISTLRSFSEESPIRPKYCNVGSEFQRLMKAFDHEDLFEFFEDDSVSRFKPRVDS